MSSEKRASPLAGWSLLGTDTWSTIIVDWKLIYRGLSREKSFFASILNGDFITNLNVTHRTEILSDS